VYDSGKPVGNIPVTLEFTDNPSSALARSSNETIRTNLAGEANFSNLALGPTYTITATVAGANLSAPVTLSSSNDAAKVILEPTPAHDFGYFASQVNW
jgi:hypothetical protein